MLQAVPIGFRDPASVGTVGLILDAAAALVAMEREIVIDGEAGTAVVDIQLAVIARLQAQIDRQISDYQKRPKRLTYGVNAIGVSYARYVEDWAARIEKIGTERYPSEARGKLYGALIITVELDRHGNVVDVIIDRPSRHEALNRSVRQIVLAGAPYAPFTEQMAREGDILQIVRTWTFTNGSLETKTVDDGNPEEALFGDAKKGGAGAAGGAAKARQR